MSDKTNKKHQKNKISKLFHIPIDLHLLIEEHQKYYGYSSYSATVYALCRDAIHRDINQRLERTPHVKESEVDIDDREE